MKIHGVGSEITSPLGVGKMNESVTQSNQNLNDKFFLVHGGDHPRKNLDFVVSNWVKSPLSNQGTLKILGNISQDTIKRIMGTSNAKMKDISFLGYVSEFDLVNLYMTAELVICPSLNEGLGLPAIDAFNLSKRVIFSDIPSHREFIPEYCTFFNPRVGSEFMEALELEMNRNASSNSRFDDLTGDWKESVIIILSTFEKKMIP
jgi:glycosyltransferase involved in cell wall biosynthesis